MKQKAFSLNICNFYTAAWCLYLLQGTISTKGGLIGRLLILIILLLSLYYFIFTAFEVKRQPYLKALNALVIMFTVYGLFSIISGSVAVTAYGTERSGADFIKQYYSSILPIYAYYSFAKDGYINERWFSKWIYVFFAVSIIAYFSKRNDFLQQAAQMGSIQTEFTNNYAYLFVGLVPAIALVQKRSTVAWVLWLIIVAFSLMSFKRGAILTTGICFLYYLNTFLRFKGRNQKRYMWLAVIVFVGAYLLVEYLMANSDYFMLRLERTEEGSVSQRDVLYMGAIQVFKNSDLFQTLFGHGANSTANLLGNGAHNDWLELLVCQGIFGVLLFVIYWITLLKTWLKTNKNDITRVALGLFFFSTFLRTLFSFSIGDMTFCTAAVVGYCLVYRKKQ